MSELRTNKIVPRDGIPSGSSGTLNGGGVLQVVTKNMTNSGTLSDFGGSYGGGNIVDINDLSLTIKPSSSSSLIWIQGFVHHNVNSGQQAYFLVKRDGNIVCPINTDSGSQYHGFASGQGNQDYYSTWVVKNTPFWFMDAPATTSTLTYKVAVQMCCNVSHIYINRGERDVGSTNYDFRGVSNLTAWEISG
tara:strand:+ start:47 stop:619 length:573 start_codon:yes stop_codon:yes gene_type:complete